MLQYDNHVKTIKRNIQSSLFELNIKCSVTLENAGKCIAVKNNADFGEDENLYIWIRLLPSRDNLYIVDISNIQLPLSKRRKGNFEFMFARLLKCKYVGEIRITSVCTPEMLNWCTKHRLNMINYNDYYLKC